MLVRKVETTEGEVLYQPSPKSERAVSEATAYLISTMLADVINAGTAWQARRVGFTLPAAGKTGTTNDYHDAWFVGYTPTLVSGVWVGYDQPRTIIGSGYAGDIAVPLWGRFMATATRGDEPEWLRPPDTITSANICRLSGKLPNEGCRSARGVEQRRLGVGPFDGLHRVFRARHRAGGPLSVSHAPFPRGLATSGSIPEPTAPPPPAAAASAVTGGTAATTGAIAANPAEPTLTLEEPAPPRRRGFWSRVFGRGPNNEERKREEERRQQEEQQRRQAR